MFWTMDGTEAANSSTIHSPQSDLRQSRQAFCGCNAGRDFFLCLSPKGRRSAPGRGIHAEDFDENRPTKQRHPFPLFRQVSDAWAECGPSQSSVIGKMAISGQTRHRSDSGFGARLLGARKSRHPSPVMRSRMSLTILSGQTLRKSGIGGGRPKCVIKDGDGRLWIAKMR